MSFELSLTQEQKLIMTQEMQLSVKLLQMSSIELKEHIENEVLENPVLEYADENKDNNSTMEYKEFMDFLKKDKTYFNNESTEEEISPFYFISEKKSLRQFLREQVNDLNVNDFYRSICYNIIDNLDDKGYLDEEVKDMANNLRIEEKFVSHALEIIQSLDPAGIGARNLKDCLKLQLKRKDILDENLFSIIENHMEDLAENKYNKIAKVLNVELKKVQEYGDIIKNLEPKPSSGFYDGEETKFVLPDAYIKNINGKFEIIINEAITPGLRINPIYKEILSNDSDKEAVDYVKQKIDNAVFLMKSIEYRKSTIYRVLEKIVEFQKDYFEFGDDFLKPMTLKDIADNLGIHESTVSRAIKDKFINISKGTIKIKDLFTVGLSSKDNSQDISTNLIKKEIRLLIDSEDKTNPFSDQGICDTLNKNGMNISRRTVAKYREELGIKSSSKRKRY
ncbi:RNA polymerase factor sigma-54 [Candidatus Clostridium radicumherbarum]|uniref:RNA polymerase factor sigma-54 n=1 Tax=Candidatus Clostridium radicumherbarum TaxID=3381662 RepID=A0ABW8TR23_9CLOT